MLLKSKLKYNISLTFNTFFRNEIAAFYLSGILISYAGFLSIIDFSTLRFYFIRIDHKDS